MQTSQNEKPDRDILSCREWIKRMMIPLAIVALAPILLVACCALFSFPPQLFGNNERHFRAHVIDPMPESVEILDVTFDDLIILPDVLYYFHFRVNRDDLEKIIEFRSLEASEDACEQRINKPDWWRTASITGLEAYSYRHDGLTITLCYDPSSDEAFYAYVSH